MNAWDQMQQAVDVAKATLSAADSYAGNMARLLRGRLRHVPPGLLVELKRELRDFDAHQKLWK